MVFTMKAIPCPISADELRDLYHTQKLTDAEIAVRVEGGTVKRVRSWRKRFGIDTLSRTDRHEVKPVTGSLKSLLIGSMLGDGGIQKLRHTARYQENHCAAQETYLRWKVTQWGSWVKTPPAPVVWKQAKQDYHGWRFHTVGHKDLLPWHALFYPTPGPKRFLPEVTPMVDPMALAIWYLDDGSREWWPTFTFGLGDPSLQVALQILDKFDLQAEWKPKKGCTGYLVLTSEEQALRFIDIIEPHVPECMEHKLSFGFLGPHFKVRQKASEEALRELAEKNTPIRSMAKELGVGATTVDRKLKKYGIDHPRTLGRPPTKP